MMPGCRLTPPPPQWYGQDPGAAGGRQNVTNIRVWAPGGAQTLEIQWFWRLEAPRRYKYNGFGAWRRPGVTNTMVLAPGGAQALQIQWFWRLERHSTLHRPQIAFIWTIDRTRTKQIRFLKSIRTEKCSRFFS